MENLDHILVEFNPISFFANCNLPYTFTEHYWFAISLANLFGTQNASLCLHFQPLWFWRRGLLRRGPFLRGQRSALRWPPPACSRRNSHSHWSWAAMEQAVNIRSHWFSGRSAIWKGNIFSCLRFFTTLDFFTWGSPSASNSIAKFRRSNKKIYYKSHLN